MRRGWIVLVIAGMFACKEKVSEPPPQSKVSLPRPSGATPEAQAASRVWLRAPLGFDACVQFYQQKLRKIPAEARQMVIGADRVAFVVLDLHHLRSVYLVRSTPTESRVRLMELALRSVAEEGLPTAFPIEVAIADCSKLGDLRGVNRQELAGSTTCMLGLTSEETLAVTQERYERALEEASLKIVSTTIAEDRTAISGLSLSQQVLVLLRSTARKTEVRIASVHIAETKTSTAPQRTEMRLPIPLGTLKKQQ